MGLVFQSQTIPALFIAVLLLSANVQAAPGAVCDASSSVCLNDTVFFVLNEKLTSGKVTEILADGKTTVLPIDEPAGTLKALESRFIASVRAGACKTYCPGQGIEYSKAGKKEVGIIAGLYPSGDVVMAGKDGKLSVIPRSQWVPHDLNTTEEQLLKDALALYSKIRATLSSDSVQPCPKTEPVKPQPPAITCELNSEGTWQMKASESQWVGSTKGWVKKEMCTNVLQSSNHENMVCAWSGTSIQFFSAKTGHPIGAHSPQHGYPSTSEGLAQCISEIKMQPKTAPFICSWNGFRYQPINRDTNVPYGAAQNGWKTMAECVSQALAETSPLGVCGWNGQNFSVYQLDGTPGCPHTKLENCRAELNLIVTRLSSPEKVKAFYAARSQDREALPQAFNNGTPDAKVGFGSWKKCEVREDAWHLTRSDPKGYLIPECSPDTLYSWGDLAKVQWFVQNMPKGQKWPKTLPRTLYTTSSAAGTFGYGDYPIRFKIKPGVKIRVLKNTAAWTCDAFVSDHHVSRTDLSNTIIARVNVRPDGFSLMEFDICSPDVIESWSYGTEEATDEILRDQQWLRTHDFKDWETYTKRNGVDDFVGANTDAGKDF